MSWIAWVTQWQAFKNTLALIIWSWIRYFTKFNVVVYWSLCDTFSSVTTTESSSNLSNSTMMQDEWRTRDIIITSSWWKRKKNVGYRRFQPKCIPTPLLICRGHCFSRRLHLIHSDIWKKERKKIWGIKNSAVTPSKFELSRFLLLIPNLCSQLIKLN